MTFVHPLMLWGMLGALIPLLVHLFDRRKPRQVPFGPIAFVLKSHRKTASRLKLKRILLYTLRTLILLAIPIALARPEISHGEAQSGGAGPHATVIVLDRSWSMRWRAPQNFGAPMLFQNAQKQAKAALRKLQSDEPSTVMECDSSLRSPAPLSFEKGPQLQLIDDSTPSFETADLTQCLELAARALEDSPLPKKRIVLVSDFTQPALRIQDSLPTVRGLNGEVIRPEILLSDAADGLEELPNHALLDVKVEPAPQVAPKAFQFTFTARNFSTTREKDVELQLKVDGQTVTKGFIDLPPQGTAQKTFTYRFQNGPLAVVEGVLSPDALAEDDTRTVMLPVPRELRALVVNGAPSVQKFRDEAFFVQAALEAPGSPVRPSVRDADAALREDFLKYDIILLLNVEAPTPAVAERLVQFVQSGGGLFISMGDRVEPEAWNQTMSSLLPRKLKLTKTAAEPDSSDRNARAARLTQVAQEHSVFIPFSGRAREGLMSARFSRYMLLEPGGDVSEVIGTLDDGAPAMVQKRRGEGRVMLFTSTLDRDWSDFAIRTSFLPWMQRTAAWLAGALEEREERKLHVGDTVSVNAKSDGPQVTLNGPDSRSLEWKYSPNGTASAGPLPAPGAWVAQSSSTVLPSMSFSVALDESESDLTRVTATELKNLFGEESISPASGGAAGRTPIWTWLMVLLALAFFLEGALLAKR